MGCAVIRLIGFGLMLRSRRSNASIAELFIPQVIQGLGSGSEGSCLLVAPQIVVPHAQISQVLSLLLTTSFIGYIVGSATAGGIYTNTLRPALWKYLGNDATQELVDKLYNAMTGGLPAWETPERNAINLAVSHQIFRFTILLLPFLFTLGAQASYPTSTA